MDPWPDSTDILRATRLDVDKIGHEACADSGDRGEDGGHGPGSMQLRHGGGDRGISWEQMTLILICLI